MYSTKSASNMTAIKPETLRTWERRFGFPKPGRDEKGRRVYSEADIDKLTLIAQLTQSGHPIRSLTNLNLDELKTLLGKPTRKTQKIEETHLISDLTQSIDEKNLRRFRFLIGYALSLHDPVQACEHILVPTCHVIGRRWTENKINIGFEHALSSVLREELISVIRTLHLGAHKQTIIFTTPIGEQHEIGLLMAGYIAASKGFQCQFWGANLPATDLILSLKDVGAKALVMSIVKCDDEETLSAELKKISEGLPPDFSFWIGMNQRAKQKLKELPDSIQAFESFEPYAFCLDSFDKASL